MKILKLQLIEDSEERLSEDQVQSLLDIVKKHFPGPAADG